MRASRRQHYGAIVAALIAVSSCRTTRGVAKLAAHGDHRDLRERPEGAPKSSPGHPGLLVLAIDGVDLEMLYDLIRTGQMPGLAALLGDRPYFEDRLLSTLPSITMTGWASVFTGAAPAEHGFAGNEFFVRQTRELVAPAPVSVRAPPLVLESFTEDYVNKHLHAPTIYERMRERDPHVLIWVAMHPIYRGADRLILTGRAVVAKAFADLLSEVAEELTEGGEARRELYSTLDAEILSETAGGLGEVLPDVLTVYLPGTDLYAHVASEGPERARRTYLTEEVDPKIGELRRALAARGGLANRYVIVTSDHGHTEVTHRDDRALSVSGDGEPPALLSAIGKRVRPFEADVDDDHDFNAVLAYQGAMAFVYLADPATCPKPGDRCDWRRPGRLDDVLDVADAFYRNNRDGSIVPAMKGALDLILVRRPGKPFAVYHRGGDGERQLVPIGQYLERDPRPGYLALEPRLRRLAVGPRGDHAGDILLIAANGDRPRPEDRYYFAAEYRSWHGSPNESDSRIPLIVAHPKRSAAELGRQVRRALGGERWQAGIAEVILELRYGR